VRVGYIKNEDTWYEVLRHCYVGFVSTSPVVVKWWYRWHLIHFSDSDGNLYVRYLIWDGRQWNRNYNWLNNDWNEHNPSASLATFFVSPLSFGSGVLLCKLIVPASKLLPDCG